MTLKKAIFPLDKFELFIFGASLLSGALFLFLPENSILAWFTTDDAFYYFVTARNISLGLGSTFDGIALTNGYHPLWLVICIPVFALVRFDIFLPLRLVILLQYLINAIAGILLYRMVRKHISTQAAYIIVFLWLFLPAIHSNIMLGGVESTLNGMLIIAVLAGVEWVQEKDLISQVQNLRFATLGALSGLAILARLDNVFFIAFVGLWVFIKHVLTASRQRSPHKVHLGQLNSLPYFVIPIILFFGAYLSWNQANFGSVMPISGTVKHWWGEISGDPYGAPPGSLRQLYLETFASPDNDLVPFWLTYRAGQALAGPINQVLNSISLPPVAKTIWILLGLGLIAFLDLRFTIRAADRISLLPLLLGAAAQIGYYKLGGSVASRSWYWVQENLLFVISVGIMIGVLLRVISRHPIGKSIARLGVTVCLLAIILAHVRYLQRNFIIGDKGEHEYLLAAEYLERKTEAGARIGLVGSGSIAYFIQGRTIVNLDGLINGYEYFNALKQDMAAAYLNKIGVEYIYGSRRLLLEYPPYASNFSGRILPLDDPVPDGGQIILWRLQD